MTALALLLVLAAAPARPPERSPQDALDRRRADIADELVRVGARLQDEISRADVAALLARVPADGLRCAGRLVPRARIERDLRAPASWLHGVLFGGPGYDPPRGAPASLRAFLTQAREIAVLVAFRRDPRAGAVGRPCLDFRARDLPTPGAPLCFEARGGRWWLTESLYPCG